METPKYTTSSGDRTYEGFFSKFYNKLNLNFKNFSLGNFVTNFINNIDKLYVTFCKFFSLFNIEYNFLTSYFN